MDVGQRIAAWCDARGVDHHQLAEKIGVTYAAVYQWVTGRTAPSLAMLEKVAAALGITMERFYGRVPKPKAAS